MARMQKVRKVANRLPATAVVLVVDGGRPATPGERG